MGIAIREFDLRVFNMKTRMPFRYGIVTLTALPHLFMAAECEVDGQRVRGIAAEHLPPKWFTKNPDQPFQDELAQFNRVIRAACDHAIAAGSAPTPFDLWHRTYAAQKQWAAGTDLPALLWGFGVSLVERAMIDAFCRTRGISFSRALRENQLGIDLKRHFALAGRPDAPVAAGAPATLLPARPLDSIIARHTVGLIDPLVPGEIPAADRLDDGLPQDLQQCIRFYGLEHFKIKLAGDVDKDLARLKRLADIIGAACPNYAFTLDGNENYKQLAPFRTLWESLQRDPALAPFLSRLIFIEQPLHRDVALSDDVAREMLGWSDRPPLIIDESDGTLDGLLRALDCGYVGTSHKNCKGIFKSIANACLLQSLRQKDPGARLLLSGEDLSNVGPVALLQDLAVAANLGIASVERNGQHYFRGLSMHSDALQQEVLSAHGDLFTARPFASADIRNGRLSTASVCQAPFGVGFDLDLSGFVPLEEWRYESLGLS